MYSFETSYDFEYKGKKYDIFCEIEYDIQGKHLPATYLEPEEFPEVDNVKITVVGMNWWNENSLDWDPVPDEELGYAEIEHAFLSQDNSELESKIEEECWNDASERSC